MEVIELNDSSEYLNDSQKSRKPLEKPGVKETSTDETKTQDCLTASFQNILKIHGQSLRLRLSR